MGAGGPILRKDADGDGACRCVRIVFCSMLFLPSFLFLFDVSVCLSLSRSITACLHSLTPHGTSLTTILPSLNHQPPIINHQPPIINHQSSIINRHLPTTTYYNTIGTHRAMESLQTGRKRESMAHRETPLPKPRSWRQVPCQDWRTRSVMHSSSCARK